MSEKVYVLMHNDYPVGVYSSEEKAIEARTDYVEQYRMLRFWEKSPLMSVHQFEFELDGRAKV